MMDPLDIQYIEEILQKDFNITVTGIFISPSKAIVYFEKNAADITFLDIQVPGMFSLELTGVLLDFQPD